MDSPDKEDTQGHENIYKLCKLHRGGSISHAIVGGKIF